MSCSRHRTLSDTSSDELEKATPDLDQEFVIDEFGPPPEDVSANWQRAKKKRGRPRKGKGVKVISVSLERDLISRSDKLAKSLGISRSALIARGLKEALAQAADLE